MRSPRPRPTRWRTPLLCGLLVGAAVAPCARAQAPAAEDDGTQSETEAKAAIGRAREATRAGDYEAALERFEHAARLQPAPKLHFNIAVCHHRLLGDHPAGSRPYEEHRAAAVDAYNRYLQAASEADDAEAVADVVRALGGTPFSAAAPEPWSIELVEPDEVPDAPGFADEWNDETPVDTSEAGEVSDAGEGTVPTEPATDDTAPPLSARPHGPMGRFGVFVPLALSSPAQLASSDELRPLPMLGLGLRGNAFLGPGRAVALGGELQLMTQPQSIRARHRMSTAMLGVLIESRHAVGRTGRVELGAGGVVAVATQTLVYRGDMPLRCSPGREASRRNGLWAQARLTVMALLGARRNHELSLRVGPGIAAMSRGSVANADADGSSCTGEPSAFETFGLRDGPALVVSFDLGYAPRF